MFPVVQLKLGSSACIRSNQNLVPNLLHYFTFHTQTYSHFYSIVEYLQLLVNKFSKQEDTLIFFDYLDLLLQRVRFQLL